MDNSTVISIRDLNKSFDSKLVLNNFNMDLKRGENLVVIGRSGIGKSVLIKCIIGLMKADNGKISILGDDIADLKPKHLNTLRRKIGFCFQGSALYDSLSVRENLELPIERNLQIDDEDQVEQLIRDALADVGLSNVIDQTTSSLSGGMQKRLSIARTLVLKPEIMLYDEPTGGLDPITSAEINNLIVAMQRKYNISSVIITHDITCARITSNRMVYLKEGGTAVDGDFETFSKQTADKTLKAFFDYFRN